MTDEKDQPKRVFKSISQPEITKDLEKGITEDALNIVVDAINSSVSGVVITDLRGTIQFANPAFCKMFDYESSEVIGKDAAELFASKKITRIVDVLSAIDVKKNFTDEFIVKRKDGETFIVEVSASSVSSLSGERIGRMASFVDITKRKILETELEKKLQDALEKIKVLSGILPICASCKKIRDNKGNWSQVEVYIKKHSEAEFSHGICPECAKELYPEYFK